MARFKGRKTGESGTVRRTHGYRHFMPLLVRKAPIPPKYHSWLFLGLREPFWRYRGSQCFVHPRATRKSFKANYPKPSAHRWFLGVGARGRGDGPKAPAVLPLVLGEVPEVCEQDARIWLPSRVARFRVLFCTKTHHVAFPLRGRGQKSKPSTGSVPSSVPVECGGEACTS